MRFLITNALIVLVLIGIALVAISMLTKKIHGVVDTISENRRLAATLALENDTRAALARDYATLSAAEPQIRQSILSADNVTLFSDTIESIAHKYNIVQSLRFDAPQRTTVLFGTPPEAIVHIGFNLSLSTNMFIFVQYLKDIEHLPYLAKIDAISVSGAGKGGWGDTALITLRGTLTTRLLEEIQE